MADGIQVERLTVVSACGEHRAITQSRCLGLTGTDIHICVIFTGIVSKRRGFCMGHRGNDLPGQ